MVQCRKLARFLQAVYISRREEGSMSFGSLQKEFSGALSRHLQNFVLWGLAGIMTFYGKWNLVVPLSFQLCHHIFGNSSQTMLEDSLEDSCAHKIPSWFHCCFILSCSWPAPYHWQSTLVQNTPQQRKLQCWVKLLSNTLRFGSTKLQCMYPARMLIPQKIHAHHHCQEKSHAHSVSWQSVCCTEKKYNANQLLRRTFQVHG